MQNKACEKCGKIFYKTSNISQIVWDKKRKYCSNRCKVLGKPSYKKGKVFPHLQGENNPNWKGDKASYTKKHSWIYKYLGEAKNGICINCGSKDNLQWSNKDHQYKRIIEDWQILCAKCHHKYDNENIRQRIVWNKGKKGLQVAWNKGKPRTWESPGSFKKGMIPWNKGLKI